jgi:predicted CopG family antitoxin
MGFSDRLKKILDDKKPKNIKLICKNFWCKAHFEVLDELYNEDKETYSVCKKCRSFDKQLSGGVTNNGVREYEGSRYDPDPQEIDYKQYLGDQMFKSNFKKW